MGIQKNIFRLFCHWPKRGLRRGRYVLQFLSETSSIDDMQFFFDNLIVTTRRGDLNHGSPPKESRQCH